MESNNGQCVAFSTERMVRRWSWLNVTTKLNVCWGWFLNNVEYTFEEWCDKLHLSKNKRIELKLKYS